MEASLRERLAVFDLETTGIDVDTSRIVSACVAVLGRGDEVVARWDWLADPGIEIPEGASAVHGITTERARAEGRPAAVVVAEIAQALRMCLALGMPVTVYNAPYDLTLLDRECRRHSIEPIEEPFPIIDPLVIDKALDRYRKGKRTLEATAERYGVELSGAHDAGADAIAAGRLARAIAAEYAEEFEVTLAELHDRQAEWCADQNARFEEYMRSVRGETAFTADGSWPVRRVTYPGQYVDTQPLPSLQPKLSRVFELESAAPRSREQSPASARLF